MLEKQRIRPAPAIGPVDVPLIIDELLPRGTGRSVVRREAQVVTAVTRGLLSVDEACERYAFSLENSPAGSRRWSAAECVGCGSPEFSSTAVANRHER